MKNKWLIALATGVLAVSLCAGLFGCAPEEGGGDGSLTDKEVVEQAVDTLTRLYKDGATPADYQVLAQVKADGKTLPITWTAKATDDSINIDDYVTVGTVADNSGNITIGITKATVVVNYTLTATVTLNSDSAHADFSHSIPARTVDGSITSSLDLSDNGNRTKFDEDNSEQVWTQNGVTLTNTGSIGNYVPIRLYKNSTISIEVDNARIVHIDFHSAQGYDDSPYPEYLQTSLENSSLPIKGSIAVSDDGLTISVDFESPLEVVTFTASAGQCRLTSIDVEAVERDPNEHVHDWHYQHVEGTWTHTATCQAAGCDVNTKTENCTPKLNVCECEYTYSEKEIVDALFALDENGSLPGTYSLTGVVTAVTDAYSTQYKNVTFEMTVDGRTVTAYRVKGTHAADVAVGGTATVTGQLLDYGGKKEFTAGGAVVAFTPAVDDRTPQEKVTAALAALSDTFTVSTEGETALPASTVDGVTFTWSTDDETYRISGNKINVTALPTEDATVTATVTAACGSETVTNNTKTVTITIQAASANPNKYGTLDAPITVTQAIALARELPSGKGGTENFTAQAVYVKGYVIEAGEWSDSAQYGGEWKNVYIADSKTSSTSSADAILVFYLHVDDAFLKLSGDLIEGTEVVIYGYVENFAYTSGDSASGTPEIADHNSVKTKAVAYTVTDQQKVEAAVAAVGDLSSASVTEDVELPTSTVTGVTFAWTVDDEDGTNAKVEGGKVTVTRTDSDATVTLTLTATCGAAEATDTYTLKILSSSAAEAEKLYTFSSTSKTGTNNSYAGNCDVEVDGVTWNVEGNSTMNPWRFGGNSLTGVDRKLTGKTAISGTVSKIVINFGTCNATVNSITLKVYTSDPTAAGASATYTRTVTHTANGSVTVEAGGEEWKDCYFQLVFNVTVSGSKNQYVTVETMEFWGYPDSAAAAASTSFVSATPDLFVEDKH